MSDKKTDELSLDLAEREVILSSAKGGKKVYKLKELDGAGRDSYLNSMSGKMNRDAQGNPHGVKTFNDLQADLLAITLYDENDKLVPIDEIRKFPAKTQTTLYNWSSQLSALDEKKDDAAKN